MKPENRASHKICVVVPAYREEKRIGDVVRAIRGHGLDVVVIDDGSDDRTAEEAAQAGAAVVKHSRNMGKGVAVSSGFKYACDHRYDAVITMDADGQHDPAELPKFIEAYVRTGIPVLVGNRMFDPESMPFVRRCTNRFMSWMLSRTMGQYVPDSQCGYRLYRCDVVPYISTRSERFAAESEILLNVAERGIRIGSVRISTIYWDERSKIRPLSDTFRFFSMLTRYRRERKK